MIILGSETVLISVAGEEIIPNTPADWTFSYGFDRFEMLNDQPCTISVNGGSPIFIRGFQGFQTEDQDYAIKSFKILESGINFNWIGHVY